MISPSHQSFGNQLRLRIQGVHIWWIGVLCLVPTLYLYLHDDYGILITAMAVSTILLLGTKSTQLAILGAIAYLALLGDIRRIVTMLIGARPLDPLLLVGAFLSLYFAVPLLLKVRLADSLSKVVLGLMAIMTLEIFNPRQGPLAVGVTGALYIMIPLFWFWIGRRYGTDHLVFLLLYRVILPLGVLCALLGIYQTYVGFFPWEEAWANSLGHAYRLTFKGPLRPFGFSSSAAEYGNLLLIASTLSIAAAIAKRPAYILLLSILGAALIQAGMRGPVVRTIFAGAMVWAIRGSNVRSWIPRLAFGLVLGIGLVSYSATRASEDSDAGPATTANLATTHVSQGLAHPFEAKYSTGGLHWAMFLGGIRGGFENPIGNGLGSTTLAGVRIGGAQNVGSTEVDISDAFVGMGLFGGFTYLAVIFLTFRFVPSYVQGGPPITRLAVVGILAALIGIWTAVGQYSTPTIAWFCVGSMVNDLERGRRTSAGNRLLDG